MKILNISCNHCGAPLEVPKKTRFVTCAYCNSRLAIKKTDSTAYTEVLEAIEKKTDQLSQDVEILKLQNELNRLDREWQMSRSKYTVKDKHGNESIPTVAGSAIGIFFSIIVGVVWIGGVISMNAPGFMALFGIVVIFLGIIGSIASANKASSYTSNKSAYEHRRRQLVLEIRKLQK